eukprot:13900063-Heterocapsa_arctica.AAC.1
MPGSGSVPAGATTGQLHGEPYVDVDGSAVVPTDPEGEVTLADWRSTPPTVEVVVIVVDGAARVGQGASSDCIMPWWMSTQRSRG